MKISEIIDKMIETSQGNRRDICHFLKVYSYAKTIGELEGLDRETQYLLEAAAAVHDIAVPLCRTKYGNTSGKNQEIESPALIRAFFADSDLTEDQIERLAYLIGHHHTVTGIDGIDYQILIEADYLVNADEGNFDEKTIRSFMEKVFRTQAGTRMLQSIFRL